MWIHLHVIFLRLLRLMLARKTIHPPERQRQGKRHGRRMIPVVVVELKDQQRDTVAASHMIAIGAWFEYA